MKKTTYNRTCFQMMAREMGLKFAEEALGKKATVQIFVCGSEGEPPVTQDTVSGRVLSVSSHDILLRSDTGDNVSIPFDHIYELSYLS